MSSFTEHLKKDSTIMEQLMPAFQCEWCNDTTELQLERLYFVFPQCSRPSCSPVLNLASIIHFVKHQRCFCFWPQPVLSQQNGSLPTLPGRRY